MNIILTLVNFTCDVIYYVISFHSIKILSQGAGLLYGGGLETRLINTGFQPVGTWLEGVSGG